MVRAHLSSFGSDGPGGTEAIGTHFGGFVTAKLGGLIPYAWALDELAPCARNGREAPELLDPLLP